MNLIGELVVVIFEGVAVWQCHPGIVGDFPIRREFHQMFRDNVK